jgi:ArsR family transcriptional regulator
MTATAQARYERQTRIIKALAHPTRLFIVEELARGERCVCELTDLIGVEMPTLSRHLSLLKEAGILADEKRGSFVFYRLRVPCVLNFFKCVEAVQVKATPRRRAEVHSRGTGMRRRRRIHLGQRGVAATELADWLSENKNSKQ